MSVQTVLRQSYLKFRLKKNGDNLDEFNPRLLDLKSLFRFNLTCYMS